MSESRDMPLLLPRPKKITLTGGSVDRTVLDKVRWEEIPRNELLSDSAGAYRIGIDAYGTRIQSEPSAGFDNGFTRAQSTLNQLKVARGPNVPAMIIDDWPSFATRGLMLDVSRDRVPTIEQLESIADFMESMKLNHLQLYTEHTYRYAGHEEVWRGWSPLTPGEVKYLDTYCAARQIQLSANQNCFGHLAKWLNHPKYQHLAETLGDWIFQNETEAFPRSGPFSLCPTDPRSIEFIKDLLGQLLPCFDSPLVNIGCDETFDVGWGRSKQAVAERGRAAVYMDLVRQIADVVKSHDKRPMFWADIALTDPKSIPLIPKDMIGLAWGYEPDAKFGQWCAQLRKAGHDVWVCPGTSSWRSITGRTNERRANIRRAAREGIANEASGFLITDWGDSGHHQQWPIALHAIAEAADVAWNADDLDQFDSRATSLHVFGDASLKIGPWLDELGNADAAMRIRGGRVSEGQSPSHLRNSSVLFCDLHMPDRPARNDDDKLRRGLASLPVELWEQTVSRIHELSNSRPKIGERVDIELSHTLDVACFAAVRGLWRRTGKYSSKERGDLSNWLRTIIAKHRELWLRRSREGGLEDSCSFYERILQDLESQ